MHSISIEFISRVITNYKIINEKNRPKCISGASILVVASVLDEGIIILQINDTRHNKQYTQS